MVSVNEAHRFLWTKILPVSGVAEFNGGVKNNPGTALGMKKNRGTRKKKAKRRRKKKGTLTRRMRNDIRYGFRFGFGL